MKTVKTIKEDIAIILKELVDARSLCTNESREPTPEEVDNSNIKLSRIEELEKQLALEERTQDTIGRSKKSTPPDLPKIDNQEVRKSDRDNFGTTAEFLQAVVNAGTPGRMVDPRLSTRAASGLSESVPSDGGFLVGTQETANLMKNTWDSGMILPRVNKITLTGNKNALTMNGYNETSRAAGSRAGGIRGYWKAEAAQGTQGEPTFRKITLNLNKLMCLGYATDELLDDANALEAAIMGGFQDELNFKLQEAIINGSGAGQPLGIINSGCMVSVEKEAGQDANSIVFENVNKMWSRLLASSRPNAIWICNQDCEPELHKMSLAVGTGGSAVFMPTGGASAQPYNTLFGRPMVATEHNPILGDTGDLMLCDFSKYIAIDKGGFQGAVSMHLRFDYDEQVFKMTYRFDGQPMLGSAITPFSAGATTATDTLSHFVKLDARD